MVLASALWATLAVLPASAVPPGTPIVTITVIRHDVFNLDDPHTSAWFYRTANALHIVSREKFIRSLLLFRAGDPLDPALLAESERLLRATGYLSPVSITARPAPGGAEVVVETRDQWTTEAGFSYGLAGSQQKIGFSLTEQNFVGWGKRVELLARSDPERDTITAVYVDPLLFGSRWTLAAAHRNATDGSGGEARLVYPFYSLDTPRAGGLEWERNGLVEYLWSEGEKVVAGDAQLRSFRLWGGIKVGDREGVTARLTAGVFADRGEFSRWEYLDGRPYETPASRDLTGVEVGWEAEADRWEVLQGFRAWSRQEDVPLGPNWSVALGASLPALGGDADRLRFSSRIAAGWLAGRQYTWLAGALFGRLDDGRPANVVLHLEAGSARTGSHAVRARVAADVSHELDRELQLTLGADAGLRGWDPNTFDGTSRAVANLEWRRRLTGEVLHLGILGVTVFADAGRTWGARVGRSTGGVRYDAGAGLVAELTRTANVSFVRVEVAFADDGSGPLVLLTGASLF